MTYRWCYYEITLFGDPHAAWIMPSEEPVYLQLIVTSEQEGALPPPGTNVFAHGSSITCQVTRSPLAGVGEGWQYVCAGWSGTGSVPALGVGTQVTFAITKRLRSHLALDDAGPARGGGQRQRCGDGCRGWYDLGATGVVVDAEPSRYHHFVRWFGNAPDGEELNPSLQLIMDWPRNLTAEFAANLTSRGTPEWWLADFGWTNEFETACERDIDSDGMAAWQEYIAGTCPTDLTSALRISLMRTGTVCVVEWPSVSNRFYSVYQTPHPTESFTRMTNGLPARPPSNTFVDNDVNAAMKFYRVMVGDTP